jgi:predicted  nucleic acid-binding Zn-ribbon protein
MDMNNTDTSADAVERLIAPIRDHLERTKEENARLQYIKATIRVNGMRHGATEDEILKMQTGGMSFIQWMVERLDYSALAAEHDALKVELRDAEDRANAFATKDIHTAAERDALQAKLHGAVEALESVKSDLVVRDVDLGPYVWMRLCATIAKLKGTDDE